MRLWSPAWANGDPLPDTCLAARPTPGGLVPGPHRSPPLAWDQVPAGARSLVLFFQDFDVPDAADGATSPSPFDVAPDTPGPGLDTPRSDAWLAVLRGLPPHLSGLAEGDWAGWRGPLPLPHDALVHHCVFSLYALDVEQLPLPPDAGGAQVHAAMAGHVLDAATLSATCTLNPRLRRG